jgi:hypothetical protein
MWAMQLSREHMQRVVLELRTLFDSLRLDVKPYSDADLVDAVLAVAPVVEDGWLSDEQARQVFQHLTGKTKPAAG